MHAGQSNWGKYQWVRSLEWWHSGIHGTKSSFLTFILVEIIFIYMFLAMTSIFPEHGRAELLGEDVTGQVTLGQGLGG